MYLLRCFIFENSIILGITLKTQVCDLLTLILIICVNQFKMVEPLTFQTFYTLRTINDSLKSLKSLTKSRSRSQKYDSRIYLSVFVIPFKEKKFKTDQLILH